MHFIIGHKSTDLLSIVLISSVRVAVHLHLLMVFQWYFLLRSCSAAKHSKLILLNSQEKNPTTPEITGKKAF